MLSLAKIAAGPRAARYYTEQVAQGIDDYYSGEGEEPGRWIGSGIALAGLRGVVDDERFAQLSAGGLRKPPGEGGVAGFDLTFRAPKSVSSCGALGRGSWRPRESRAPGTPMSARRWLIWSARRVGRVAVPAARSG
jgi:hypothetical protein